MTQVSQYLKNTSGGNLSITYASNVYKIPSPGVYVDDWDVPEDLREELVQHALGRYSRVRPPTAARDKQKPAKAVLTLEKHDEEGEVVV